MYCADKQHGTFLEVFHTFRPAKRASPRTPILHAFGGVSGTDERGTNRQKIRTQRLCHGRAVFETISSAFWGPQPLLNPLSLVGVAPK